MRIVMAGSSGFLGSHLRARLAHDGHEVVRLVRRAPRSAGELRWDPDTRDVDAEALAGADVVVNLAGAPVGPRRWTAAYKRTLVESRVRPTSTIAAAVAGLPAARRPRVMLNASGIDVYGDTGDRAVDEEAPAGSGFAADMCGAWEVATEAAAEAGVRVVRLRSGLVLDGRGGLLPPLARIFRLFAGGPLGGGRQWMPWISLDDWLGAVMLLIGRDDLAGPVNVTGPAPVRNSEFTSALAQAVHRPAPWPVPRVALRIILGEFADQILESHRIMPGVLTRSGYAFQHPDLEQALRFVLARR